MSEARRKLFRMHATRIEKFALSSRGDKVVVVLLHLADSHARRIAEEKFSLEEIDAQVTECVELGLDPCFVFASSYLDAGVFFSNPETWTKLKDVVLTEGSFAVVIFGDGGTTFFSHGT